VHSIVDWMTGDYMMLTPKENLDIKHGRTMTASCPPPKAMKGPYWLRLARQDSCGAFVNKRNASQLASIQCRRLSVVGAPTSEPGLWGCKIRAAHSYS
jgi:hypothetical protein